MPGYRFKAADAAGKVTEGVLQASGPGAVVEQLHARGLIPIRVEEAGATGRGGRTTTLAGLKSRRVSRDQLVVVTRELATLLQAGLPLYRALDILISMAETPAVAQSLGRVREGLKGGASLADALAEQKDVFSHFYVNLVRAGEAGGALETVLQRLADHLERGKEMRDSLLSALIYPAILVLVAVVSIFILLGYVVPQFTELFEGVGQVLPLPTGSRSRPGNSSRTTVG